nr:DUF1107 family protein [Photobacterium carnosum]
MHVFISNEPCFTCYYVRISQVYCPIQVAKFVDFFKGRLFINGISCFKFEYGRLLLPNRQILKC